MSTSEQYQKGYRPEIQSQDAIPGLQHKMDPEPHNLELHDGSKYKAAGKLEGKKALITGGDSGIGRATSLVFAMEGADLTIVYLPEEEKDAQDTVELIKQETGGKRQVELIPIDLKTEENCIKVIKQHLAKFETLDALVLNHATQKAVKSLLDLPTEQWHHVFDTNIHSFFYLTKAALPHMKKGSTITMNASINPFVGHPELVDYTATKGAIIGFMRAMSNQIVGEKGIRVNAVCPGPIWTPLIPATMSKEGKESFGVSTPMERPGQPIEVATCFLFFASPDSGYLSGQTLHPNGGSYMG